MKRIFFQTVPNKVAIIIICGVITIIAVHAAYKIGHITGEAQCALVLDPSDNRPPVKNPMQVPLFIDLAHVKYETRFHFTYDPVDVLHTYREQEDLDSIVVNVSTHFEKVLRLLHWAREQWEPGRPDPYPPINAQQILQAIRTGQTGGFCAQYNYVFVQAVQSFGMRARYVTIRNHEVTEVWIPEFGKWVCFDPLYTAYYTNQAQVPLSVYEVYKSVKQHTSVLMITQNRIRDTNAHLSQFNTFAIWIKNNHISSPINFVDIEYYKVHFYEEFNELSSSIILHRLTTSSVKDLYGGSYE
jgi:hypothetical protein